MGVAGLASFGALHLVSAQAAQPNNTNQVSSLTQSAKESTTAESSSVSDTDNFQAGPGNASDRQNVDTAQGNNQQGPQGIDTSAEASDSSTSQ
jgi:hypothetical protein